MTTRYSFTAAYIAGAVLFARRARSIEANDASSVEERTEHRAAVAASVMQSSAALECETAEISMHGPGHQLGSNRIDHAAKEFLEPIAGVIDGESVLDRYDLILHLLRKPSMDRSRAPHQDADLLIGLRNDLVHYKSHWDGLTGRKSLLNRLAAKKFAPPPWFAEAAVNFYPHRVLSASCADWAAASAARFLDHFYGLLGVPSILDGHRVPGADYRTIIPARDG
jgi:hypothetical protein